MSAPAWSELEALFHDVLACPAAERVAVSTERCAGRPELRVQVEALDVSAMITHAPLEPGTRLGVYEIAGRLGAGGMSEVTRAIRSCGATSPSKSCLPARDRNPKCGPTPPHEPRCGDMIA